jgi:hypothetical protein
MFMWFALCNHAVAQSVLEVAAGVKFCKTLTDDAQRLKCFDGLFAEKPSNSQSPEHAQIGTWTVQESKSPLDDTPQVSGTLLAENSAGLILRCKERKTEVIFAKQFSYLGSQPIKALVRINDGKLIETVWSPSTNGQVAFAPSAVQFIHALPDNGKLFIRVTGFDGKTLDGEFSLGNVSEIRDKIAVACNWPKPAPASAAPQRAVPSAQR